MPAIVTFDGVNKIITEISALGDNELNVIEIYSEWKEWVLLSDNAKFLSAFSVVGGDAITSVQNLGSTFFLENGWRIRPAELNHKLTLVGNLFTREEGQSVFVATIGAFTVNTETRVSSLVDSSVARLDLDQLLQAVYIDPINGVSGTDDSVGTPTNPSNNIIDARAIADIRNLFGYEFRGSLTVAADHADWFFHGLSALFADVLNISGVSVNKSRFEGVVLTGTVLGKIECLRCRLEVLTGLNGDFYDCHLAQTVNIANDATVTFDGCSSRVPFSSTPILVMGTNVKVNIRNYSGGVEIRGMTAGCEVSVDLDPGKLILTDSSNTGGNLLVRGTGTCNIGSSVGTTVDDTGLADTAELYTALQTIAGNAQVSSDDLTVTIRDKDNTTVLRTFTISADGRTRTIAA